MFLFFLGYFSLVYVLVVYVHIVPVGTSLLGNVSRDKDFGVYVEELGFKDWERWSPDDPRQRILCEKKSAALDLLRSFVEKKGFEASAELTPLDLFLKAHGHSPGETMVILYSTDTCNSLLARDAVAEFLEKKGFKVVLKQIVGIRSVEDFDEGLKDLLDKIVSEIIRHKNEGRKVFVNASPGFKSETTFLVIAALIACADKIYYAHESFRKIVYIPGIPLTIREDIINILRNFEEEIDQREAEERLGGGEIVRDFELRGLIEKRKGLYKTREWIKNIINITTTKCIY